MLAANLQQQAQADTERIRQVTPPWHVHAMHIASIHTTTVPAVITYWWTQAAALPLSPLCPDAM